MSVVKTDLYDTLGVRKTATKDTIQKAFRKRARKAHPDAGGDPVEFQAIHQAYKVLTDDTKREKYDQTGEVEPDAGTMGAMRPFMDLIMGVLGQVTSNLLQSGRKPKHCDMIQLIRDELTNRESAIAEQMRIHKENKAVAEDMAARFETDGDENYLQMLMRAHVGLLDSALKPLLAESERLAKAKELLGKFRFRVEKAAGGGATTTFLWIPPGIKR